MCTKNHNHMMYGSWDMECNRQNFCHYKLFLPYGPRKSKFWKNEKNNWKYYHFTARKIKIKNKWKNCQEISSFYISVPKIMISWCMVPEICCMTDVIVISHFGLFFALLSPNSPKNQNFEKMKKMPGDIIILHKCVKNHDHMLYCSWDMACDRCNCYFSFWAIFCPFTPLTAQKIKILKKWKKYLEISPFYIWVPKIMIRWCMVPEIWCVTDVIVISHFGLFFALLPP